MQVPIKALASSALLTLSASAQLSTSLLNEGDPIPGAPGEVVGDLHTIATNNVGGYAISMKTQSNVRLAWGSRTGGPGTEIRRNGFHDGMTQSNWDTLGLGFADSGGVTYSATVDGGLDSIWCDDTLLAVAEDPSTVPGTFWKSFTFPAAAMTSGEPWFLGYLSDVPGGAAVRSGMFMGPLLQPLVVGGDVLPGLPEPLDQNPLLYNGASVSPSGNHWVASVQLVSGTRALIVDGAVYMVDGHAIVEDQVVPPSMGGNGAITWTNVQSARIADDGTVSFYANDTGYPTRLIVGTETVRENGDIVDGSKVASLINLQRNEAGQVLFRTYVGGPKALVVDDTIVAQVGEPVDFDGDGVLDPGAKLSNFTGNSNNYRLGAGGFVYYTASVDVNGTPGDLSDDVLGFYRALYDPLGPNTYCTATISADGCLAQIDASGYPAASGGKAFDIDAKSVPIGAVGMLTYGLAGAAQVPFQGGTLCVLPPLRRTLPQLAQNMGVLKCSGTFGYDFAARLQAGADVLLVPGADVSAQYVFRDPATGGAGIALSNAVRFVLRP